VNRRLLLLWLAACAKEATPAPIQEPPKPREIVERSGARLKIEASRITDVGRECSIELRGDRYFCGDVQLARVVPHADMAVVPIWFEGADGSIIHDGFHDTVRDADCTPTKFVDEADYACVVGGRHVPEDPRMTLEAGVFTTADDLHQRR
jgi:hypothetical protein